MRPTAELTLGREPEAVVRARRLVGSFLAGGSSDLEGDVKLVVTELVTNALLHGQPPIRLRLSRTDERVRVEVGDTAPARPLPGRRDAGAMTGRGLALVGGLSRQWGVNPGWNGSGPKAAKTVWAEIEIQPGASHNGAPAPPAEPDHTSGDDTDEPTFVVNLGSVPTDLLLEAKAHIDNVVRELQLVRHGQDSAGPPMAPAMASLIESVTGRFAWARTEIKRQALAAAARGDAMTPIELRLPLSYAEAGEEYLAALDEADRYAREARLLTLAPPDSHREFREWYVRSLVQQLRSLGAGQTEL